MAVPSGIAVSSTAPQDIQSVSLYLTTMLQQIQNWIAISAQVLNATGGYVFSVDATTGNLIVTSPNGTVTVVGEP